MMKDDNRSVGGRFETALAARLADAGFWCHVMQQNKAGQPADIIAVIGHFHTLIDCKVISDNKGFAFERVEENQKYAMKTFLNRAYEMCYFALRLPDGEVRMVSAERIEHLRNKGKKRMTDEEIREGTWPLNDWIAACITWGEA